MAKSEFQKYAAQVDATWETSGFEALPDGAYNVVLDKALIKQAKSQAWMLSLTWKVEGGDHDGRLTWQNLMFEGKNGWNPWQVKNFFNDVGFELPEFDEIEDAVEDLVGNLRVAVELTTDGEYQNLAILEVLDEEPEEKPAKKGKAAEKPAKNAKPAAEEKPAVKKGKKAPEPEPENDVPSAEELAEEIENIDEWEKDDLLGFAEDYGFELKSKTVKKMIEEVKAWVQLQGEPADIDEADAEDPDREALYEFCVSSGVEDIEEDMDIDELKEILGEYEFKEEEMTADEVALLEKVGLGEIIERKKAAKAPARRGRK